MNRDTQAQLVAAIVLVAFLAGSVFFTTRVAASVGANKLSYTERAADSDPPQVGLGIAMGAFR
ncbi:MAG: hypothetical protein AAGK04_08815, partial [Planctomycetota bacterium]